MGRELPALGGRPGRRMVNGTRVVVTGTGTLTSLGLGTLRTWEQVKAGRSGTRRIEGFDASGMPSQVARNWRVG